MLIGGTLGYWTMCQLAPPAKLSMHANPSVHRETPHSILESYFEPAEWGAIAGKTIVDYGCGTGGDAFALVRHGAAHVIGVEVREWVIQHARENAQAAGCADRCTFLLGKETQGVRVDAITCTDVMEHVDDPDEALRDMARMLPAGGTVYISFNSPWYHPSGGHLFSVFPWAHLLFTEKAMIRWRRAVTPSSTARCYRDTGLNQITVQGFLRALERSPFRVVALQIMPIRALRWLHNRMTREFTTSGIRCRLVRK
jgi:ubiquinone/menaquinone biosynthesis C-methylase UbiE